MIQFGAVSLLNKTDDAPVRLLKPQSRPGEWSQHMVLPMDNDTWQRALVKQAPDATTDVKLFQGKGGFAAIVTTDDLTFVALPGSRIQLADTMVNLPGQLIQPSTHPVSKVLYDENFQPQQVTRQAMILGAGLATRFEPVSGDATGYSKPSVPLIGEDSVIVAIARHLKKHGFNRILVNTFYKPDQIKQQLTSLVPGVEFVFIDEEKPSGTAGGLARALREGKVNRREPILIMQGDAVTDADLSLLVNTHAQQKARATIGVQQVSDENVPKVAILKTDRAGSDGESGRITHYVEKPSLEEAGDSRMGSIGFYVLSPEIFGRFERMGHAKAKADEEFDYAKNFFPALLEGNRLDKLKTRLASWLPGGQTGVNMWAQQLGGYWSDVGNPAQYIQTVKDILAGRVNMPLPANMTEYFEDGVIYWPGARAKARAAGTQVEGNVIVAETPRTAGRLNTQG